MAIYTKENPFEIEEQIVDPVKVTKTALDNACLAAGTLITTEIAIAYRRAKDVNKLIQELAEALGKKG